MAVHDDVPGIEVTVRIDGQTVKEYEAENDESRHKDAAVRLHEQQQSVTKYIEAITGKEFGVHLDIRSTSAANSPIIMFRVFVDGLLVRSLSVKSSEFQGEGAQINIKGVESITRSGRVTSIKMFQFTEIETKTVKQNAKEISQVGEILVKVFRVDRGKELLSGGSNSKDLKNQYSVHEKAMKGDPKSHGASLGRQRLIKNITRSFSECLYLDGSDYPLAIFKFKYRSNEALKQLHVIQRTPEPEPEPVPDLVDMIDDLTAEEQLEMRELAAKLKKRRHKAIASGADQLDKSGDDSNLGRKKRRTSGSISVVDLTEKYDSNDINEG